MSFLLFMSVSYPPVCFFPLLRRCVRRFARMLLEEVVCCSLPLWLCSSQILFSKWLVLPKKWVLCFLVFFFLSCFVTFFKFFLFLFYWMKEKKVLITKNNVSWVDWGVALSPPIFDQPVQFYTVWMINLSNSMHSNRSVCLIGGIITNQFVMWCILTDQFNKIHKWSTCLLFDALCFAGSAWECQAHYRGLWEARWTGEE